ncbi:hypothetical protein MMC34_007422 [Xylographa carneopallida]|nr:hypothetical protein [Xylographa carneopallida]
MRPSTLFLPPATVLLTVSLSAVHTAAQAAPSNLPNLSTISTATTSADASPSTTPPTTSAATPANTHSDPSTITSAPSETPLSGLPGLSTSTTEYDGISNAPKLSGAFSYPAPTVPPTALAPFMQKSPLPSGTVFICVGAIIGFLAFAVLAWRGLVAWSLHRSVQRAATGDAHRYGRIHGEPGKGVFRGSGTPFYSHGHGSNLSLDPLVGVGATKTGKKGHTPQGSLFFSPTAGTGAHTPANRTSTYLPAGYYAAGSSAPAHGASTINIGGGAGDRLSHLTDLGPQRQGYTRAQSYGPSPPRSPSLPPSREQNDARMSRAGISTLQSGSAVTLGQPAKGTAPSAYLDELFDYPPERGR